jgi:hypothetical protein
MNEDWEFEAMLDLPLVLKHCAMATRCTSDGFQE